MSVGPAQTGGGVDGDDTTDGAPERPTVSHDECFDLLSNHRRRYTLHYLQQSGSTVPLGGLAEQVAAWENETTVDELSYDERKRVYTSLQQVHLPRMDTAGVVEFDDREGVVEIGPAAEDLDIYLEVVQGRDIPWSLFYFGLAVANGLFVMTYLATLWPGTLVPAVGVPVFVVTSFLLTSIAHLYITRTRMRLGGTDEPPSVRE